MRDILYGTPILPGAMFLYALLDRIPVLGFPACVYYHKTTIFDLILPIVLAGDGIDKNENTSTTYPSESHNLRGTILRLTYRRRGPSVRRGQ